LKITKELSDLKP